MEIFASIVMLIALYLLYRIAYPQQARRKTGDDVPEKRPETARSVMGKSRFVLPDRSKPLQTPATFPESENSEEKASIFASESEESGSAAVSPDGSSKAFTSAPDPKDLDIAPDEEEEVDFEAEEAAEAWNRIPGNEKMLADGVDFEELQHIATVVKEQPETVSEETGRRMVALEHTDLFETLASGDEGKMNWIKAVIDRHVRERMPQTESKISNAANYDNFIADFLG